MALAVKALNSVRLEPDTLNALLDRLDAAGSLADAIAAGEVFSYRSRVMVYLQQPGEIRSHAALVPARTLSRNQLTFLYGGYVHCGTPCRAQLTTCHGSWTDVEGHVVACDYLERSVHEVTIALHRPVDPAQYTRSAARVQVLVVEDCPVTRNLVSTHLHVLKASVETAGSGEEALEKVAATPYDLILMDIELPGMDGCETAERLRQAGFHGLIVANSALSGPENQVRCLQMGCDRFLAKPYTRQDLADLLHLLQEEPLYSTYNDDPTMGEVIKFFVKELGGRARSLEIAAQRKDWAWVESTARWLRGAGTSFGFPAITEAAGRLENMVRTCGPDAPIDSALQPLLRLCRQARAGR
jgi:CheY-like chemotaxis protein